MTTLAATTHTPQACLFLKAPRAGTVKTRLARDIGPERALRVYRALVEWQVRALPAKWETVVYFAPAGALVEMQEWLAPHVPQGVRFQQQCEGDLGERLATAVCAEFNRGATRLFLLGGDCPDITTEYLTAANAALADHDIVLGPARDGGYVLMGLRAPHPALFQGIAWSTETVLTQTRAAAQALSLSVALLPTLEDVDDIDSLARCRAFAASGGEAC